jgi:hypothetical protein
MKDMIDNTMPSKRGAPEGNKNAKNKKNNSDQIDLIVFDETIQDELNELKQINQLEKDENKCANDNVNDNVNVKDNGNGNMNFKNDLPPQILKRIISEAHRLGFIIDEKMAIMFYRSKIDPAWYEGPYSFLALAAERAKEQYRDKPHHEQQNLFNDAVISWKNLRDEYPPWLEGQQQSAKEAEQKRALQKAKENIPKQCQCGGKLNKHLVCEDCHGYYPFNEKTMAYEFSPAITKKGWRGLLKSSFSSNGGDPCP